MAKDNDGGAARYGAFSWGEARVACKRQDLVEEHRCCSLMYTGDEED